MDLATLTGPGAMRSAGEMATSLLAAEPWRAVTALTLHADMSHLTTNAMGIGAFGLLLSRRTGLGVAVAVAVAGGAVGNVLNAYALSPTYHWVGASTAVFALLGACAAAYRSVLILVVGIALTIASGAADVSTGAHAFGLLAGLLVGLLARTDDDEPAEAGTQVLAAGMGLAAVAGSWFLALG